MDTKTRKALDLRQKISESLEEFDFDTQLNIAVMILRRIRPNDMEMAEFAALISYILIEGEKIMQKAIQDAPVVK